MSLTAFHFADVVDEIDLALGAAHQQSTLDQIEALLMQHGVEIPNATNKQVLMRNDCDMAIN